MCRAGQCRFHWCPGALDGSEVSGDEYNGSQLMESHTGSPLVNLPPNTLADVLERATFTHSNSAFPRPWVSLHSPSSSGHLACCCGSWWPEGLHLTLMSTLLTSPCSCYKDDDYFNQSSALMHCEYEDFLLFIIWYSVEARFKIVDGLSVIYI